MRLLNNYVLIKLYSTDKIKTKSGLEFIAPLPRFQNNEEEYKPLRGEVVKVPERLIFIQGNHAQMPWDCDMELQVGDDVIIKRPALSMALGNDHPSFYIENGDLFVLIKYNELVCAIRNKQIIMLNGFLLVEPIEKELAKTEIPGFEYAQQEKKNSSLYGTIAHIGKPNREYHITKDAKGQDVFTPTKYPWIRTENGEVKMDMVDLKVGDKIQFAKAGDIKVEQDLFQILPKPYFRMPRTKVIAVV